MVTQRKPTILTPKPPPKPTTAKPSVGIDMEVRGWRSRPTAPGFTGEIEPPFYGTEDEVRERAVVDEMVGAAPAIEQLRGPIYVGVPHDVPTVQELGQHGMAREVTYTTRSDDGRDKVQTRWEITPTGQQVILDAMAGLDE